MKHAISVAAVLATLVASSPVLAHHSTNLAYDAKQVKTYEGEFVRWRWINPHAIMEFNVTGADGQKQLWVAETHGSGVLARAGWRPSMFKPGDKVTLSANPPRQAAGKAVHMLTAKGPDGKVWSVNKENNNS